MERFNYPNLAAVMAESTEVVYLMECESYGRKRDEQEELDEMKRDAEQSQLEAERADAGV